MEDVALREALQYLEVSLSGCTQQSCLDHSPHSVVRVSYMGQPSCLFLPEGNIQASNRRLGVKVIL